MQHPPADGVDPRATAGPIDAPSRAVRTERLLGLLRGEGLDRGAVEELLRPESLDVLRPIVGDHPYPGSGRVHRERGRDPANVSGLTPDDAPERLRDTPRKRDDDRAAGSVRSLRTGER